MAKQTTDLAKPKTTAVVATPAPKTLKDFLTQPDAVTAIDNVARNVVNRDRLIKVALIAVNRTPKLANCTWPSVLESLCAAADLGLEIGSLRQGYLVPFKDKCQFIPGYGGLITLAHRSQIVADVEARIVYRDEVDSGRFTLRYGSGPSRGITHEPMFDHTSDADVYGAYAIFWLRDKATGTILDHPHFDFMSVEQMEAIRKRSPAGRDGPWVTDRQEMYKKCPIRRGSKTLPLSPDDPLAKALAHEDEMDLSIVDQWPSETIMPKRLSERTPPALEQAANEPATVPTTDEASSRTPAEAASPALPAAPASDELVREVREALLEISADASRMVLASSGLKVMDHGAIKVLGHNRVKSMLDHARAQKSTENLVIEYDDPPDVADPATDEAADPPPKERVELIAEIRKALKSPQIKPAEVRQFGERWEIKSVADFERHDDDSLRKMLAEATAMAQGI